MKNYSCKEAPFVVFGVPFFYEKMNILRVPAERREQLGGSMERLGRRCPGSRIGFRTDAAEYTVKMELKTLSVDIGMSLFSCQSINVMVGERKTSRLVGLVDPPNYETRVVEKTFHKSAEMEEVTLWLPRNEEVEEVTVTVPDEARIEPPTPYRYGKTLFYGSSITEGGCCCNPTTNYIALLSRWLDMDFYNFGFSGSAKAEPEIAAYIRELPMSVFVFDYDHNAKTVDYLQQTHEVMFQAIRQANPELPVVIMSRPKYTLSPSEEKRLEVIRATYENAKAQGDQHVYFIDGKTLMDLAGDDGTVDSAHPNDLGFASMAKAVGDVLAQILHLN